MSMAQSSAWGGDRRMSSTAKFQTLCGRTFDSNVALANFSEFKKVLSVTQLVRRQPRAACTLSVEDQRSVRILTPQVSDVTTVSSIAKKK